MKSSRWTTAFLLTAMAVVGRGLAEPPSPPTDSYGDPLPEGALARLGTTRFRLGNFISDIALSPDGASLAAVGGNSEVRFWNIADGKEIRRLQGHQRVAYSPDGKTVATARGYFNKGIAFLDARSGKELRELDAPQARALAFASNGQTLVGEHIEGEFIVWEVATGKRLHQSRPAPRGRDDWGAFAIAISPDGRTLAYPNSEKIMLWDLLAGNGVGVLEEHGRPVYALAFSPDGKWLASGDAVGHIWLWDVARRKQIQGLKGDLRGVSALAFSPDGKLLASGSGRHYVPHLRPVLRLWDVASGKPLATLGEHSEGVAKVLFSNDGRTLISAEGNALRFWDVATRTEIQKANAHQGSVSRLAFSPGGKMLASVAGDQSIRLWDLVASKQFNQFNMAKEVDSVVFSRDGKWLMTSGRDSIARVWDVTSGKEIRQFADKGDAPRQETRLALSPDGAVAAFSIRRGEIILWAPASGKELRRLRTPLIPNGLNGEHIEGLSFSSDGRWLASAGSTQVFTAEHPEPIHTLRSWDVQTGQQVRTIRGHKGPFGFGSIAYSPCGRFLASIGQDGTARLWYVNNGTEVWQLKQKGGASARTVLFSRDGKSLYFSDGTWICVYETATGKLRRRWQGHDGLITGLTLSADGTTLASGGADTTILVWPARPQKATGPQPLSAAELESLWWALAQEDAAKAYEAIVALSNVPAHAVPFFRQHLQPVGDPHQRFEQWLAELDDDRFQVRERASKALAGAGIAAEQPLQKALKKTASPEVRRRIEQILEKLPAPLQPPEQLRVIRAIEVLEHIGTTEARAVLETLANGAAAALETQEAKRALARLFK